MTDRQITLTDSQQLLARIEAIAMICSDPEVATSHISNELLDEHLEILEELARRKIKPIN